MIRRTMKPPAFSYARPTSLEEALLMLSENGPDARILAGGQSLIPMLSLRLARPALLVDLARIPALDGIELGNDSVSISCMVRESQAERSEALLRRIPILRDTLPLIGHEAIRNRGTLVGSLCHADPAAELPAVALALDAVVIARSSAGGTRRIAARDFFLGPYTTSLREDELVTAVELADRPWQGSCFLEVSRRRGDFAMAGLAAFLTLEGGAIQRLRLSFCATGDRPTLWTEEDLQVGGLDLDDGVVEHLARVTSTALEPIADVHGSASYKKQLAAVLVRRGLRLAQSRARAGATAESSGAR